MCSQDKCSCVHTQPHAGFPESKYHDMAEALARAGHRVVVVEQVGSFYSSFCAPHAPHVPHAPYGSPHSCVLCIEVPLLLVYRPCAIPCVPRVQPMRPSMPPPCHPHAILHAASYAPTMHSHMRPLTQCNPTAAHPCMQTETPDALAKRNEQRKKEGLKAAGVVMREKVAVLSKVGF